MQNTKKREGIRSVVVMRGEDKGNVSLHNIFITLYYL